MLQNCSMVHMVDFHGGWGGMAIIYVGTWKDAFELLKLGPRNRGIRLLVSKL